MLDHDALRRAGRARGEDDVGQVVGVEIVARGPGVALPRDLRLAKDVGPGIARLAHDHRGEVTGTFHLERADSRKALRVDDNRLRTQDLDQEAQPLRRKGAAQGDPAGTALQAREHGGIEVGVLGSEDAHALVGPGALRAQEMGEPVGLLIQGAVAELRPVIVDRDRRGRDIGAALEEVLLKGESHCFGCLFWRFDGRFMSGRHGGL